MRTIIMTIVVLLPVVTLLGAGIASAAEFETKPDAKFLVSCSGVVGQNGLPACNWCSFVQLIGNMIQYSIYLAVMLSALMFAYAGFLFLTNNGKEANITKAWSIFRRSLLGTVAILAAWLIVNAIMTKLATGLNLEGNWNSITGCDEVTFASSSNNPGGRLGGSGSLPYYPGDDFGSQANEYGYSDIDPYEFTPVDIPQNDTQSSGQVNVFNGSGRATGGILASINGIASSLLGQRARSIGTIPRIARPQSPATARLNGGASITVCDGRGRCGQAACIENKLQCTFIGGLKKETVLFVEELRRACGAGCRVRIVGAAEPGHEGCETGREDTCGKVGHSTGRMVNIGIGLASDARINAFIKSFITPLKLVEHKRIGYDKCGNEYMPLRDHWEVAVYRSKLPSGNSCF